MDFGKIAEGYGVEMNTTLGIGVMFSSLLDSLCEKFGKKVVILIDEYDKGFLEVLHDEELLKEATSNLRPFFQRAQNVGPQHQVRVHNRSVAFPQHHSILRLQ